MLPGAPVGIFIEHMRLMWYNGDVTTNKVSRRRANVSARDTTELRSVMCPKGITSANFKDLTGQRFGRLTVIRRAPRGYKGKTHAFWVCDCDCGQTSIVDGVKLRSGHTRSCGCFEQESRGVAQKTHGMSKTNDYAIWVKICRRCYNPNCKEYPHYGGRGITMCDRWRYSFENFTADMGPRPSKQHSIDRIDNEGPYSPENCRWVTIDIQANNTSANHSLTYSGRTMTVAQWAKELSVSPFTLYRRAAYGWSDERIITTPVRAIRRR